MMFLIIPLMAALVNARYQQDMSRPFKSGSGSSLMNFGKIDVSFYINTHHQDLPSKSQETNRGPPLRSTMEGPCPCSNFKLLKEMPRKPSDILGKLLSGNDLFTYKEPRTSMLCCDSHENVREDILLEFSPKQTHIVENSANSFPLLPFIFENIQRPKLPAMPSKTSAVEIVFYPKQGSNDFDKLLGNKNAKNINVVKKDVIKIVGDKDLRNDIKSGQYIPPLPSSVKKDLTGQFLTTGIKEEITTPNNKSNII